MKINLRAIKVQFTFFVDRYSDAVELTHAIRMLIDVLIKVQAILESAAATPRDTNA